MKKTFLNKTILVFGASGYIGSSVICSLQNYDCTIVRISRDITKLQKITDAKAKIIDLALDFTDLTFLEMIQRSNIIYYFASQTSTYMAEKDILLDYANSVEPILLLLGKCKEYKAKPILIFSSTATVCGIKDQVTIDETVQDIPITVYDIHKLLIENYINFFINKNYINGSILRLSNVYGPGVKSTNSDRGILNLMIQKAVNNENLPLYGSGEFIRDYIYIDDVVDAFLYAVKNIENTNGEYYIIGNEKGMSIKNAFLLIQSIVKDLRDISINIDTVAMPSNISIIEKRNFIAISSKFKRDTQWISKVNLEKGIKKTIQFITEYEENR